MYKSGIAVSKVRVLIWLDYKHTKFIYTNTYDEFAMKNYNYSV